MNKTVVKNRFTDLKGKSLLNLGCGYGWYSNYFVEIGARVTACDGSEKMISPAKNTYKDIDFELVDIEKHLPYNDNEFDIVFCNQVLMDIENVGEIFQQIFRVTRQGGRFYMAIVHPAFYDCLWGEDENGFKKAKIMEKYLSEYNFANPYWGETQHFHRTISYYINRITDCGFRLTHMEEPKSYDGINKSDEFPLFLFMEFIK